MTFTSFKTRRAALLATSASMVLAGMASVSAQDADAEEGVEEVVVTGSRIVRTDLAAPSPVTVVGQVDLQLGNAVNSEQFLNSLPQAIPGLDASSNNPGRGEVTVDLRGLGDSRSLVLVNGRRWVAGRQAGVVDLNTIPASLVKQIDVVTGGASAVYGSDAVAGVVNFILKDDFEGIEIASSLEVTDEFDGEIFDVNMTLGGNFADGKGNATLHAAYTRREAILQGERDGSFITLTESGDRSLVESGSVNIPGTFIFATGFDYTAAGIETPVNGTCSLEGLTVSADGTACVTDSLGAVFRNGGTGIAPFINSGPNTSRFNYAPDNFLQTPQERWNIAALANYHINDDLEVYTRLIYTNTTVDQLLAPTPTFISVTINADNPFLGEGDFDALRQLGVGDADGNGVEDVNFFIGRRNIETGGRLADNRNDAAQFALGLRGNLDDNWHFDLYGHYNQGNVADRQTGNVSISAYQAVIREGRANIFEPLGLSPEVAAEIQRNGAIIGSLESFNAALDISGELVGVKSPWADLPVAAAFGVEYRAENFESHPDSVLGPDVIGFNQAPDVEGDYHNVDFYGELQIPLVQDKALAKELSVNGAFRYSDYSTVGSTETYAFGLSWSPIEDIRFRAQYQRAVRAPNIDDLFSPQTNSFPGVSDTCSGGAFGGFDNLSADEQNRAREGCIANGVPASAVGTPIQPNQQIEALIGGNPNLFEESSDTYTFGVVISPSFIDGLNITVDYYDIKVEDAIGGVPPQTLFDDCYVNNVENYCAQITRRANGSVDIFNNASINIGRLDVEGIDFSIDYNFDIGDLGTIGIYSLVTWTDTNSFIPLAGADRVECAGTYGGSCGEPTPEWKANTRVDWTYGRLTTRLRWNYIDSVVDNNAEGVEDTFFSPSVGNKNYIDLSFFYDLNENVSFSAGVKNLFDTDFVIVGDQTAPQSNTFPSTYETLGQQYFIGARFKF